MQLHDVATCFASNSFTFGSHYCLSYCAPHPATPVVVEQISIPLPARPAGPEINIAMMTAVAINLLARKAPPMALTNYEITKASKAENTITEWRKQISPKLPDCRNLFDEKLAPELPPDRPYDHSIPLLKGKEARSDPSMA